MTEILFYHLENQPLERVLPVLLEKTIERGWRAVIETTSRERAEALDAALWTYRDDSFLAHGIAGEPTDPDQPILITTEPDNANAANVRFYVDRAVPGAAMDDGAGQGAGQNDDTVAGEGAGQGVDDLEQHSTEDFDGATSTKPQGDAPAPMPEYTRIVYMFSGHDPDAVTEARVAWRALGPGNDLTYWQQDANGRWTKKG